MKYFETRFLEEANEFISGLETKTVRKIFYNIDLFEYSDFSYSDNSLMNI